MEFGDFAMLRRMLRGIKARAEAGQLSLRLGTLALAYRPLGAEVDTDQDSAVADRPHPGVGGA